MLENNLVHDLNQIIKNMNYVDSDKVSDAKVIFVWHNLLLSNSIPEEYKSIATIKNILNLLSGQSMKMRLEVLYLLETIVRTSDKGQFHLLIFEQNMFASMNKIFHNEDDYVGALVVIQYLKVLDAIFQKM